MTTIAIADSFIDALNSITNNREKSVIFDYFSDLFNSVKKPRYYCESAEAVDSITKIVKIQPSNLYMVVLHESEMIIAYVWVGEHSGALEWCQESMYSIHPRTGNVQCLRKHSLDVTEGPRQFNLAPIVNNGDKNIIPQEIRPFTAFSRDQLFDIGVPESMLESVLNVRTASELDELGLPAVISEILFDLATGASFAAPKWTEDKKKQTGSLLFGIQSNESQRHFTMVSSGDYFLFVVSESFVKKRKAKSDLIRCKSMLRALKLSDKLASVIMHRIKIVKKNDWQNDFHKLKTISQFCEIYPRKNSSPSLGLTTQWSHVDQFIKDPFRNLARRLRSKHIMPPVVGYELLESGNVVGVAELAWPTAIPPLALVESENSSDAFVFRKQCWNVVAMDDPLLLNKISSCLMSHP